MTLSNPSIFPYNTRWPHFMYEDLTMELMNDFNADGDYWEDVSLPWDDYDDYLSPGVINNPSYLNDYEITKDRDVSTEQ